MSERVYTLTIEVHSVVQVDVRAPNKKAAMALGRDPAAISRAAVSDVSDPYRVWFQPMDARQALQEGG